ncbi:hypothetical protein V2W45_298722 [Cenococcum geophilum]
MILPLCFLIVHLWSGFITAQITTGPIINLGYTRYEGIYNKSVGCVAYPSFWRRFDEGHGLRRKCRRRLGDWANDYVWRSFNPPFRAAVAEYPWWQSYSNDSLLEIQYSGLLSATNSTNLACFRSLPEDTLDTASQTIYTKVYVDGLYKYGSFYYGPSIDGDNNARPSFQRI